MAVDITTYTIKQGADGSEFVVILRDANKMPSDLSVFSEVRLIATKQGRDVRVIDDTNDENLCEIFADQVASRGKIRYEFTELTSSIPTGIYRIEFHGRKNGELVIWPTKRAEPYGLLIVQEPA